MNNEELFLKKVSVYLDVKFNEFDKRRILGFLDEYKATLPLPKPKTSVITVPQIVVKYVERKTEEPENDAETINPMDIIEMVSRHSGISTAKMKSKDRYSDIILARHSAMYLIHKLCHETLLNIGRMFNRDHTSVISSIRNVTNMLNNGDNRYTKLIGSVFTEMEQTKQQTA